MSKQEQIEMIKEGRKRLFNPSEKAFMEKQGWVAIESEPEAEKATAPTVAASNKVSKITEKRKK